jgi:hypothetical protein
MSALGRSKPHTLSLLPDGTVIHARPQAKVRGREQGRGGLIRRLVTLGAPEPSLEDDPKAWLTHALKAVGVRPFPHAGNLKYAFALGSAREKRALLRDLSSLPYPKQIDLWRAS